MKVSVITPSIRPETLDITQKCLERQTCQDFEWNVTVGLRNRGFTLPSDWNKLIRQSSGDIIFMVQDCITISDDAIEKIIALDHTKRAYTFPVSKEQPNGSVEFDWRLKSDLAIKGDPITGNYWEIDLASAPRSLFYDVGGFDESFNDGWSWENVEIAWRAVTAGYKLYCSQAISGVAIDHDAKMEHPFRNKLRNNDWRARATAKRCEDNQFKLGFL